MTSEGGGEREEMIQGCNYGRPLAAPYRVERQRGYNHRGREGDECEEGDTHTGEGFQGVTKTGGKEPCRPQRWPRKLRLRLRLSLRAEARDKEVVSEAGRKQKQDWSEGR